MSTLFQAIAGALIAVVLCGMLERFGKDIGALLTIAVCVMIFAASVSFLRPVMELIRNLEELSLMDHSWTAIVFKAVGIGLISQFAALICADSGNSAMAKAVELLAASAILWLCIPLMEELLSTVQLLLGEL